MWWYFLVFFLGVFVGVSGMMKDEKRRGGNRRRLTSRFSDRDEDGMYPFPRALQLDILYRDGTGDPTARVVDVDRYSDDGNALYIRGFCHLRNGDRTFRVDRILRCVNCQNNQEIENVDSFIRAEIARR